MTEKTGQLWMQFCTRSVSGASVPTASLVQLCESTGLSQQEFINALGYLREIGAVQSLTPVEIAKIGAGKSVGGQLVAMTGADKWIFCRVFRPLDLQAKFAAQLSLGRPDKRNETRDVASAIAEIGLTTEELIDAKKYLSAEGELPSDNSAVLFWQVFRRALEREGNTQRNTATLVEFRDGRRVEREGDTQRNKMLVQAYRSWKQMEKKSDSQEKVLAAANLATWMAERDREWQEWDRVWREAEERRQKLEQAFAFVSMVVAASANAPNAGGAGREPIPKSVQHEVWRRDQGRCVQCGSQERLHFDHVIPWSKGGSNTARNLQLLCEACNLRKSDSI